MKLIILSIFHSDFIFYHKLNKDLILTLLQCSIPTLHYHPHVVFSYCMTVKALQGIQLCYKPVCCPNITWLYGVKGFNIIAVAPKLKPYYYLFPIGANNNSS